MEGGDLFGEDQAVLDASLQPDVCASLCSALVQTLVALSSPLILFFFSFPFCSCNMLCCRTESSQQEKSNVSPATRLALSLKHLSSGLQHELVLG